MNRCNISFARYRVEDCLELNFKYVDHQTLAHLSYSSCVCLTSVRAARAQRFLSVRELISDSMPALRPRIGALKSVVVLALPHLTPQLLIVNGTLATSDGYWLTRTFKLCCSAT